MRKLTLEERIARLEKLLTNEAMDVLALDEDVLALDEDEYSKLAAMLSSMVPAKMRKALRMGADPDMSSVKHNHGNGCTALRSAAIMGEYEPARILIEAGADVNAKDTVGKTPLDYATAGGFDDIVELLLDNGGKSGREVRRRPRHRR